MGSPRLSAWLLEKIHAGEAILFLGAGASLGASTHDGRLAPTGPELRDLIADKFLGGRRKDWPLARVADYAKNTSSIREVQAYIGSLFEPLQPAAFHEIIPRFRWHALITTNFDLIVERAYDQVSDRLQNVAPIIRDEDNFSSKISDPNIVPFLKLHGCISLLNDPALPLILASEEYAKYETGRRRLFGHFKDWGQDHPVIFCGYDISDPHVEQILFSLCDLGVQRPTYAVVGPSLDDLDDAVWKTRRFEIVPTTFETFLEYLDSSIPKPTRILPALRNTEGIPISRWFKSTAQPSKSLVAYLDTDLQYLYPGMPSQGVEPSDFYQGLHSPWGAFERHLDLRRRVTDELLAEAVLNDSSTPPVRCYLLKGYAGSGKTITLKRCAWDAVHDFDRLVLFLRRGGMLRPSLITELYTLVRTRITIFISDAIRELSQIVSLLETAKREKLDLTLICGVRTNEWNVYGGDLAPFLSDEFELRDLSETEIKQLLDKLAAHGCLGDLKRQTPEDRVRAFRLTADRQLLVALHEATSGKPFEDVVFDEYNRIVPTEAQVLYLDICTLHRLGAPVRASLIARISGITFTSFRERLLLPLQHVVRVREDSPSKDYVYRSRHPLIAEFVFTRALVSAESRSEQIVRIIRHMNVDYKWDREAFEKLIRGRQLASLFADRSLADAIYAAASKAGASSSHIEHQRAVFELSHPGGSAVAALRAIQDAEKGATRGVAAILHTRAMVLRRLANEAEHTLEKEKHRREALAILSKGLLTARDSYWHSGLVSILLDELNDRKNMASEDPGSDGEELTDRVTTDLIVRAETTLSRALQLFPEDEHLLSLEARLSGYLDDQPRAVRALKSAFKLNARNEAIAARLAEHYRRTDQTEKEEEVLTECVKANPSGKIVRLKLAQFYMRKDESGCRDSIEHQLKRSFTEGDTNYVAQILYARFRFLYGNRAEAERIFASLRTQRIPPRYRNRRVGPVAGSDGEVVEYTGDATAVFSSYCFVRLPALNADVFIHFGDFSDQDWDHVVTGSKVRCKVAFSVRGPCGIEAQLVG